MGGIIVTIVCIVLIFFLIKFLMRENSKEERKNLEDLTDDEVESMFTITVETSNSSYSDETQENFESLFKHVEYLPLEIKKSLKITYKSGNGKKTEREIDILELALAYNDDIMIEAYCHLRNSERSFYVNRMTDIVDLDTGEFITNRQKFFKHLIDDYLKTDEYKQTLSNIQQYNFIEKFKEDNNIILAIMGFIVRADGTFTTKERVIVNEYVHMLDNSPFLDEKSIKRVMKAFGVISYQNFQTKVRKLGDTPPFDLIKFTEKIIETQKTVSENETKALNYLKKRFNKQEKYVEQKPIIKKIIKDNPLCAYCHSKNTIKKGTRKAKNHTNQRYECSDCGRIFSEKIDVT